MSTPARHGGRAPRRIRLTPATRRFDQAAHRGESGAILLLALAFITIVMVLTVALLGLAKTENAALRSYRTERVRRYNVDSALQEAIQMVKLYPKMGVEGTASTDPCHMEHGVRDELLGGGGASGIFDVTQSAGYITVECTATPPAVSGITSGATDSDGGQGARDVTFEVRCNYLAGDPVPNGQISCGSGSAYKVLARARVRYDIDYSVTPVAPNCNTGSGCTASTVRAIIPKVISWSLRREGTTS